MRLFLLIFFSFLFLISVTGQERCLPQGIRFGSQSEIDAFANEYPDCKEIIGTVEISSFFADTVTNFESLRNIEKIGALEIRISTHDVIDPLGFENLKEVGRLKIWAGELTNANFLSNLERVNGDFELFHCDSLKDMSGFSNLNYIGGKIDLSSLPVEDLNWLPSLEIVNSDLDLRQLNNLKDLSKLNSIKEIRGDLGISTRFLENLVLDSLELVNGGLSIYSEELQELSLKSLTRVGGYFSLQGFETSDLSGLSSLRNIDGNYFYLQFLEVSDLSHLSNLNWQGHTFSIIECNNLKNFRGFESIKGMENFDRNGKLWISDCDNLESLEGLSGFTDIPNEFMIRRCPKLKNLKGLTGLTKIDGKFIVHGCDSIENLSGIESAEFGISSSLKIENNSNLTSLAGLDKLKRIKELKIYNNQNLNSLEGLDNLEHVTGNKNISNNSSLENLDALINFRTTYPDNSTEFIINNNSSLSNIDGLRNFEFNRLKHIELQGNHNLSLCGLRRLCNFLSTSLNGGIIGDNAAGCDSVDEIIQSCNDGFSKITGQVFYDSNQNGIKETDEFLLPNIRYDILPVGEIYFSKRTPNTVFIEPGDYTIIANPPDIWNITTAKEIDISLGTNDEKNFEFGIYPSELKTELVPFITTPPFRCNSTITLAANISNSGTTFANGTLWLEIDNSVNLNSFMDAPDEVIGNRYGWHFTNLVPGELLTKSIRLDIPGPPVIQVGQQVRFNISTDFNDNAGVQDQVSAELTGEILCSYDPNDKLVSPNRDIQVFEPAREVNFTLFDEKLKYTIRFQNTGNDVAYDVVIRDTLDENLDFATFQILSSSHYELLNASVKDGRFLTFSFRDIFLPDSNSDFEGSQGYIMYSINTKEGIIENTPVKNTASIYFDLNPPIVTNTTENIMVSELPTTSTKVIDNELNIHLFPNPTSGILTLTGKNLLNAHITITDPTGKVLLAEHLNQRHEITLPERAAKGIYFVWIETEEGFAVKRIMKE